VRLSARGGNADGVDPHIRREESLHTGIELAGGKKGKLGTERKKKKSILRLPPQKEARPYFARFPQRSSFTSFMNID